MAGNAPGKHWRKGMTLMEVMRTFPNDEAAEQWFMKTRWPDGERGCPHCGSVNTYEVKSRKPQPFRCHDCRKYFSVKTGTVMQSSNLGLQVWALAFYLLATGLKGTASMKLHRDLGVTQKTAWHLAHRIRETWQDGDQGGDFEGAVEVDEGYFGGKSKNKHAWKRKQEAGRGPVNKTAVVGMKERGTGRVLAKVVENNRWTDSQRLGAALLRREVFALFMGLFARGCVSPVLSSGGQQPSQHVPASFRRPAEPRNGTEYRRSVPLGRAPFWTFARRSGTVPWAGGQTCDGCDDRIPGT